jgi:hypothetical protein
MKKYFSLLAMILSISIASCDKDTEDNGGETSNTIYGCTDVNAINYNADATVDNGSCEYSVAYTVSGEWTITYLEYETEIDLTSIDPSTLPAEIAPYISLLGDNIPIEGDAENAGAYILNYSDNSYQSTLAFNTEPVPIIATIELPSMPINLDSQGTWELQSNDEEIVFVDATTGAQQVYEIENLTDDFALLRGSLIMPMEVEFLGSYDFEIELVMQLER